MNNLHPLQNPFVFSTAHVRTATDDHNQVWFCAKDVCDILGIQNPTDAVKNLEEDERDVLDNTDTIGRNQPMLFVSESGLYALIFKSNKPEARQFRRWVTKEVLPAIRKQGFYGQLSPGSQIALRYQKIKLLQMLKPTKTVEKSIKDSLAIVCNQLGEPQINFDQLEQEEAAL